LKKLPVAKQRRMVVDAVVTGNVLSHIPTADAHPFVELCERDPTGALDIRIGGIGGIPAADHFLAQDRPSRSEVIAPHAGITRPRKKSAGGVLLGGNIRRSSRFESNATAI